MIRTRIVKTVVGGIELYQPQELVTKKRLFRAPKSVWVDIKVTNWAGGNMTPTPNLREAQRYVDEYRLFNGDFDSQEVIYEG